MTLYSRALAIVLFLLGCLPSLSSAQTADRAPIPLRHFTLFPPPESAGTGLEPEVKLRATVDERGRLVDITVLDIKPSTELDGAFRTSTIEQVGHWRYAPAIEDGKAVPATLDWTVQFRANSETVEVTSSNDLVPPHLARQYRRTERHNHLLSLPNDKKAGVLKSYSRIAEKHLVKERRQQVDTPRFVVITDAEHPELVGAVANNLEVSLRQVHDLYQPHLEAQPTSVKILVYLYSSRYAFYAMRNELMGLTHAEATYYAPGLITTHLEVPSSDHLMSFLVHEATHAYSDHHVRRPGGVFPRWFEEGFAEYMGNSQIKKGQLLPGKTLKRQYVLNHFRDRPLGGAHAETTAAGGDLAYLKQAVRRGDGLSIEALVAADRDTFYGEESSLYYSTAWLFVHFLRHGEPGWEEYNFPLMVLYMAEGYSAASAVEAAYQRTAADFEATFQEYVRKF